MRRLAALALLLPMLLPSAARGEEIVFGATADTQYTNNIFNQPNNIESGGSFRAGPTFQVQRRRGSFTYSLQYRPSYEVFYTLRGIDSWYQYLDLDANWRATEQTELFASNDFSMTPIRNAVVETADIPLLAIPTVIFQNDSVTRNISNVGLRHNFTPRWLGEVNAVYSLTDYENELLFDSDVLVGRAFLIHALYPTDQVGFGLGATRQSFSQSQSESGSTTYFQAFGIWNHQFSPTLSLKINAGPTLVDSSNPDLVTTRSNQPLYSRVLATPNGNFLSPIDVTSCQPIQGVLVAEGCAVFGYPASLGVDENGQPLDQLVTLNQFGPDVDAAGMDITYFGDISLIKEWRRISLTLNYSRSASSTSGLGQSVVLDNFTATGVWRPSPVWRFSVIATWLQRSSESESALVLTPIEETQIFSPVNIFGVIIPGVLPQRGARALGLQPVKFDQGIDITNLGLVAQVNRTIGRRAYVFARFNYTRQTTSRDQLDDVQFDRWAVGVGFRYEFEPFFL